MVTRPRWGTFCDSCRRWITSPGSAFSSSALSLNNLSSFSTYFSFQLSNPGGISDNDGIGADGLVFVVRTVANNVGGGAGGGLGYSGIQNSVGVEFDSWDNGMGIGDPNGNHVAVDFNGDLSTPSGTTPVPTRLNDGQIWHAWVDYDGSGGFFGGPVVRSPLPAARSVDRCGGGSLALGQPEVFVGFTAGTGAAWGDHDILSWKFASEYLPINVPDGGASLPALVAGCFGLRGLVRRRR